MKKGGLDIDPRGLIYESFRIDGIGIKECRTIFLDWALGVPDGDDLADHVNQLLKHYGDRHPEHPMTGLLRNGREELAQRTRRQGGRSGRRVRGASVRPN